MTTNGEPGPGENVEGVSPSQHRLQRDLQSLYRHGHPPHRARATTCRRTHHNVRRFDDPSAAAHLRIGQTGGRKSQREERRLRNEYNVQAQDGGAGLASLGSKSSKE